MPDPVVPHFARILSYVPSFFSSFTAAWKAGARGCPS